MAEFHNAYHFFPIKEKVKKSSKELQRSNAHAFQKGSAKTDNFHAKYTANRHSGKISFTLVVKTPLVLGGKHTPQTKDYTIIDPFTYDGKLAIPATSIKGMVSHIAEAASASAMRVLENQKPISYRSDHKTQSLSAMGMIVKDGEELKLLPLVAPNLKAFNDAPWRFANKHELWIKIFDKYLALKTYIGNYGNIRTKLDFSETVKGIQDGKILISPSDYFSKDKKPEYVYLKLGAPITSLNQLNRQNVHYNRKRKNNDFIYFGLSQNPINNDFTLNLAPREAGWVRGKLYMLGVEGREDMVSGKKHEYFIPFPDMRNSEILPKALNISQSAIELFNQLASQVIYKNHKMNENLSEEQRYPYMPISQPRPNWKKDEHGVYIPEIKEGQIVYFDVEKGKGDKDLPVVSKISYSAIWREAVKNEKGEIANLYDFINETDPELVPYHKGRKQITLAEKLFGFIDSNEEKKPTETPDRHSLAGRVRFSMGKLETDKGVTKNVTLKILASPKPPSPALYFRHKDDSKTGLIKKSELKVENHEIQGRKQYLHQKNETQWKTQPQEEHGRDKFANQKAKVKLINKDTTFSFSVTFDNLSDDELNLLCFALKPSVEFQHKLGMGKPLGLGSVKVIKPMIEYSDRAERYRNCPFTTEKAVKESDSFKQRRDKHRTDWEILTPDAIDAIMVLGESHDLSNVHYPRTANQDGETDGFDWFVKQPNQLLPISNTTIPQLVTLINARH